MKNQVQIKNNNFCGEGMKVINSTLLIVRKNGKLLLGRKKRGFGEGKYNGVGGKLEFNETPDQAMLRETMEEVGIIPLNWQKVGYIEYDEMMKGERSLVCMHLYIATDYEGEPKSSDEVEPFWFDENNLPWNEMLGDDIYWYHHMLEGKKFKAKFCFDDDFNVVSHNIDIVENLD